MLGQIKLVLKSIQQRLTTKIKTLFSFYQIVTKIGETYMVAYPQSVEKTLEFFAFTNLELDGLGLPLACIGLSSVKTRLLFSMLLPYGLLLFFAAIVWLRRRRASSRSAEEERRRRRARESGVLDADFVFAVIPDLELLQVAFGTSLQSIALRISFFAFPIVSSLAFKALRCDDLDLNDELPGPAVMSADLAIVCWDESGAVSGEYRHIREIAYVAIALYPVGVPLSYMALFYWARHALRTEVPTQLSKALDFLVGEFDSNYFFWELLEVTKKLLLVGAMSIVKPGEVIQIVIGFVLTLCFTAALLISRPYKRQGDDVIALASGLALTMFFFFSLLLKFQTLIEAVAHSLTGQLGKTFTIDPDTTTAFLLVSSLVAILLVGAMIVVEPAAEGVKTRQTPGAVASGGAEASGGGGGDESSRGPGSTAPSSDAPLPDDAAPIGATSNGLTEESSAGGEPREVAEEVRLRLKKAAREARRRSLTAADSHKSLFGDKERPPREVSERRSKQLANKAAKKRPSPPAEPSLSQVAEGAQGEGSPAESPAASSHEQHVASSSSSMPPDAPALHRRGAQQFPADSIGDAFSNFLSEVPGAHCSRHAFTCPGPSALPVAGPSQAQLKPASKQRIKAAQANPATTSRSKSSLMVAQSKGKAIFRV